jgi:hypothetical protein
MNDRFLCVRGHREDGNGRAEGFWCTAESGHFVVSGGAPAGRHKSIDPYRRNLYLQLYLSSCSP